VSEKIGYVTDVHAMSTKTLKELLSRLEEQGVKHIYSAGDLLGVAQRVRVLEEDEVESLRKTSLSDKKVLHKTLSEMNAKARLLREHGVISIAGNWEKKNWEHSWKPKNIKPETLDNLLEEAGVIQEPLIHETEHSLHFLLPFNSSPSSLKETRKKLRQAKKQGKEVVMVTHAPPKVFRNVKKYYEKKGFLSERDVAEAKRLKKVLAGLGSRNVDRIICGHLHAKIPKRDYKMFTSLFPKRVKVHYLPSDEALTLEFHEKKKTVKKRFSASRKKRKPV
jgi:Icc-related predicted phosphoesterase